jgi:hypothetical protein
VPGAKASDVYLIAPRGTVDAGAAGVRVAGNLSVAALRVLNADNIQVGGVSVGVPTLSTPSIGGLLEGGAAASANTAQEAPKETAREQPSIIIVEVLGYGGGQPEDQPCPDNRIKVDGKCPDSEKLKTRQQTGFMGYNPTSSVQILGASPLTNESLSRLTEEERRGL